MSWAYVWAVVFSGKRWGNLVIPAVLMLGVLPDVDLFLWSFGVQHHTFTHSLFFWLVVSVPFLAVFRLKSIPYLVAVVQHFVFGAFLVGEAYTHNDKGEAVYNCFKVTNGVYLARRLTRRQFITMAQGRELCGIGEGV